MAINRYRLSDEQFSDTFETSLENRISELKIPLLEMYCKEIIEDVRNDLFSRMLFVVLFVKA